MVTERLPEVRGGFRTTERHPVISGDTSARNYRLRVLLPTGIVAEYSLTGDPRSASFRQERTQSVKCTN